MTAYHSLEDFADQLNDALAQLVDLFAKTFHARASIRTLAGLTFLYYKGQIFYGEAPSDHVPIDRCGLATRVEFTRHVEALWDACQRSEISLASQTVAARDRVLLFVKEHAT